MAKCVSKPSAECFNSIHSTGAVPKGRPTNTRAPCGRRAHSLPLQPASPVFASVLNSEIQEGMNNSVSLPGKTKCELEMLYKSLQVSTEESLTPESATCLVKWG